MRLPQMVLQRLQRLGAVKAKKQVSDGLAHSQRDPAPPAVFLTVVKHVATLAKSL